MQENQKTYTLITGGSSGIGFELARLFARDGYNLILVARTIDDLVKAKVELSSFGVDIVLIPLDLFNPEAPFELYREIRDEGLVVDILINDAGQGLYGHFKNTDIQRELAIVQLNISSLLVLTKLFLKDMLERGEGKIMNVSSIASRMPGPWQAVYDGTKAFVQSFTEALRSEVKEEGIVVTALMPGATDTNFFTKAEMLNSKAVQDKDKLADPADVAEDGYEALMANEDKVVSGFKNKIKVAMSKLLPEEAVADIVNRKQKPAETSKKDPTNS